MGIPLNQVLSKHLISIDPWLFRTTKSSRTRWCMNFLILMQLRSIQKQSSSMIFSRFSTLVPSGTSYLQCLHKATSESFQVSWGKQRHFESNTFAQTSPSWVRRKARVQRNTSMGLWGWDNGHIMGGTIRKTTGIWSTIHRQI